MEAVDVEAKGQGAGEPLSLRVSDGVTPAAFQLGEQQVVVAPSHNIERACPCAVGFGDRLQAAVHEVWQCDRVAAGCSEKNRRPP